MDSPETKNVAKPLDGMRHVAIHNPAQYRDKRVALIGVGTIGSHLAGVLGRMQVAMTLYDFDTVEEHNLTTQTYGEADIGKPKVEAVMEQLAYIQPEHPHLMVAEKFEINDATPTYDLIISAVDSLDARREIAQSLIDAGIPTPILDGRVGREQVEVYHFEDAAAWLEQLPEKGDVDPCGARFTAYSAVIAAGLMANNVKRFFMEQMIQPRLIFDAASYTFLKL